MQRGGEGAVVRSADAASKDAPSVSLAAATFPRRGGSRRLVLLFVPALAVIAAAALPAQQARVYDNIPDTRRALADAEAQGRAAAARAQRLESEAARVGEAAEKTARDAAALAARIQQAEADIAGHEARIRLIAEDRRALAASLAQKQQPLVRLTAALQRLSRRPPILALLRPGSVRDAMYMRALFATMLPEVEQRTAALKVEIDKGRALERRARFAARQLRISEGDLETRRRSLLAIETRQRLASREATGSADREAERALALAEQARDLGTLVADLGRAGALRQQLALLPGPVMRPQRPEEAQVSATAAPASDAPTGLPGYMLPVSGRLVTGFGDGVDGGSRSRGLSLATRPGAQLVAPAPGRVAFAGPYRGYGQIVIIEHAGGWTTLVTGLARLDAAVGDRLVAGSPLGVAGAGSPVVTVELRHGGEPVNPLQYLSAL